jgi:hypothetical protein
MMLVSGWDSASNASRLGGRLLSNTVTDLHDYIGR